VCSSFRDTPNVSQAGWQALSFGALHRKPAGCAKLARTVSRLLLECTIGRGMFMLKITEDGRARCASLDYAERLNNFTLKCQAEGVDKEIEEKLAVFQLTSELTEGSGPDDTYPTIDEIVRFADEHKTEIDATIAKMLDTLTIHFAKGSQSN
jgi:hypothetical protein